MTLLTYSLIFLGAYIALLLFLTLHAYLQKDHAGYIIGNRNQNLFSTTCSMLAGQFNGGGVFIIITMGLAAGYGLLWIPVGFLAGYILLACFAKKVHAEGLSYNDVNVPDILSRRLGPLTQYFGSFIIVGKALLFGTAQLLIAGTVTATLIGIPNVYGIMMIATLIALYVSFGGYATIIKTDIVQWLILFLIALSATFFLPFPTLSDISSEFIMIDPLQKWGFILFTFVLIISNADVWQRMMSAHSSETAQKSLCLSGGFFFLFVFALILIVKSWTISAGDHFTFFSLFEEQALSPLILATLGVFTLTAVMSTIDTQVQLFSSAVSKNILKIDATHERNSFIKASRIASFGLLITMTLIASLVDGTAEFILKAFSFAYILAPIMIASMLWGEKGSQYKDYTCLIALCIGLILYIYMFFNGYFSVMINNTLPAGVTAMICLLGYSGEKCRRRI